MSERTFLEQAPYSKSVLPSSLTIKGYEENLEQRTNSNITSAEELPQKPRHRHSKDEIISLFTMSMMEHIIQSCQMIPEEEKNELQETAQQENISIRRRSSSLRKLSQQMLAALGSAQSQMIDSQLDSTAQASMNLKPIHVSSTASQQQKAYVNTSSTIEKESGIEQNHLESQHIKSLISQVLEEVKEEEVHHCSQDVPFCSITDISDESRRLKDGNAVIVFTNGMVYEGHITQSLMDGEGQMIWPDGSLYEGDFTTGQITGKGYSEWPDLSWYDGDFCLGYRHGLGMYRATFADVTYSGKWYMGCKEGLGILYYSENLNDYYNGEWVNNERHGLGMRSYPSHTCYYGQWMNGLQNGIGTIVWSNNDLYQGSWKNGKMCGYGEYTWSAFLNLNFVLPAENKYCGEWKNGKRCGNGNLNLRNGVCIKGQWKDGYKDGPGMIVYTNGTAINGDPLFSNDHLVTHQTPELPLKKKDSNNHVVKLTHHSTGQSTNSPGTARNTSKTKCSKFKQHGSEIKAKNKAANSKLGTTQNCTDNLTSAQNAETAGEVRYTLYNIECIDVSYHLTRWIKFKYPELNFAVTDEVINEESQHYSSQISNADEEKTYLEDSPQSYLSVNEQTSKNGKFTEVIKEIDTEKKWLYDAIIYYLPYIKKLYTKYACLFSEEDTTYQPILFRLLLWQLLRDCHLHECISLIELDILFAENSSCLFESAHDPFEPIQVWQFMHILLDVSWVLYTSKGIKEEGTYGELASGFQKLLVNNIQPITLHLNGEELLKYIHVLPLEPIYLLYRTIGEAHTARDLLNYICRSIQPENCFTDSHNNKEKSIASLLQLDGKNIFCNGHPVYLTNNKMMNFTSYTTNMSHVTTKYDENTERKSLSSITPHMLVSCMASVCPQIQPTAQLICNMDYKLTFLEFYEIIVASALAIPEDINNKG